MSEEKWIVEARMAIKETARDAFDSMLETADNLSIEERWAVEVFVNEIYRLQKKMESDSK